ncbi:MAG: hypothetical protein NWQ17_01480 [Polaribacter sp.]|nr:hypothetical protein [Polaribacter sp.]
MIDNATSIISLFERAEDFSKTNIELYKLNVTKTSAEVISSIVASLAIFSMVALSLLIINIGLAFWIGKLLNDTFYGFFVIGGFYAIFALLLFIFRNHWIKNPLSESIIRKMLKK